MLEYLTISDPISQKADLSGSHLQKRKFLGLVKQIAICE